MKKIRLIITMCALMLFGLSMTVSAHEHEGHIFSFQRALSDGENGHKCIYYCSTCYQYFYVLENNQNLKWYKNSYTEYVDDDYVTESYLAYGCPCGYEIFSAHSCSIVGFKNSKNLRLYVTGKVCKGDQIKVKVGNKTYKKKLKGNASSPIINLKIKSTKNNAKVKVWITHKGKKILLGSDYIKTCVDPKIGMTKEQLKKYTLWVPEDGDWSGSGLFYGEDGSTLIFKNGKVYKIAW